LRPPRGAVEVDLFDPHLDADRAEVLLDLDGDALGPRHVRTGPLAAQQREREPLRESGVGEEALRLLDVALAVGRLLPARMPFGSIVTATSPVPS